MSFVTSMYNNPGHQRASYHCSYNNMNVMTKDHVQLGYASSSPVNEFSSEIDDSWKTRQTKHWSNDDLLNFIYTLASKCSDITIEKLAGENFRNLSGSKLYTMTSHDFVKRDPLYGQLIYNHLQTRIQQDDSRLFDERHSCEFPDPVTTPSMMTQREDAFIQGSFHCQHQQQLISPRAEPPAYSSHAQRLPKPVEDFICQDSDDSTFEDDKTKKYERTFGVEKIVYNTDVNSVQLSSGSESTSSSSLAFGPSQPASVLHEIQPTNTMPLGCSTATYTDLSHSSGYTQSGQDYNGSAHSFDNPFQDHHPPMTFAAALAPESSKKLTIQRLGKYCRNSQLQSEHEDATPPAKSSYGNGPNKCHLWEFIRKLLKESETLHGAHRGEKIIQWEDRSQGVFRIVNSKAVAKLWGEQKDNRKRTMTYEKLSRALRWCQTARFLTKVPADRGFPKKLCFQFGDKATNWRDFDN